MNTNKIATIGVRLKRIDIETADCRASPWRGRYVANNISNADDADYTN